MDKVSTMSDLLELEDLLRRVAARHLAKVFIVERDFMLRKSLQSTLAPRGYIQIQAFDQPRKLQEAIDSLGKKTGIVFYELDTPGLNALEFLAWVRQKQLGAHLKVVLTVSKPPAAEARDRLQQLGVSFVLVKPVDMGQLSECAKALALAPLPPQE